MEILPIGKNYCLSAPLHWVPKISFILTVSNSPISAISSQPIVYPKVIAFSTTMLLASMLIYELGHRNKSQKPHPTSPLLMNYDFETTLHMTDFSMASSPELHDIHFPENCVIHN